MEKIKTLSLLLPALLFAGCNTAPAIPSPSSAMTPPAARSPLETNVGPLRIEDLTTGETLKAYSLGRVVDPNDPNLMHETHAVYRREQSSTWNLQPTQTTAKARQPENGKTESSRDALVASFIEQNDALTKMLGKLRTEIAELQQQKSGSPLQREENNGN